MATTTPFAYNTGGPIGGTSQVGDLAVGITQQDYSLNPGGVPWWMGPDQESGYVIAVPVSGNNQPTPISGVTASVGFYRTTAFTDSSFIQLTNTVFNQNFSSATQANTWLSTNGYWTSYQGNLVVGLDSGNASSYSGSGSVWNDLSGNNNDATLINSPTFSSSNGGILQFDDVSLEYGTIPNIGNLSAWTVEAWFRITTSLTGKVSSLVSNEFDLANKLNFSIGTNNAPFNYNLAAGFFDGSGWHTTTGFAPQTNVWYQVVGTYDGTTIRQYVNGSASGGTVNYTGNPQSGGQVRLMRRWDSALNQGNLVDGDLAIINIYNTALSSGEITSSWNSNKSRFGL